VTRNFKTDHESPKVRKREKSLIVYLADTPNQRFFFALSYFRAFVIGFKSFQRLLLLLRHFKLAQGAVFPSRKRQRPGKLLP
jgi:hypothetical protein